MTDFNSSPDIPPTDVGIDSAPAITPPSDGGGVVTSAPVETPAESSVLDVDLPAGMQQFDRTYVEKVRREAAENRTRAREYEQQLEAAKQRYAAFESYTDDEMAVWSDMGGNWAAGDFASAAQTMQNIAIQVLGDPTATAAERTEAQAVLDDPSITAAAALTEDQVREIARQESQAEKQEAERQAGVEAVFAQLAEAGYEKGTADAFKVLWYANNETDGDIDAAIARQRSDEQAVIDRYVEQMANGGTPVRLPASGTVGDSAPRAITDLSEARHAAQAWLSERAANR